MLTIDDIRKEVEAGLQNEQGNLLDAQTNQDYFDGKGFKYLEKRFAEDDRDFSRRRKRFSMVTYEIITALCRHLYNPGPTRTIEDDAAADEWMQEVWKALDINTLWHEADVLSTLNDYCAFQVVGTDDPDKPVDVKLWGREEMAVWTDPENAVKPAVVCTIDKYDNQIRYRAWDAENVGTWITRKFDQGRPSNSSDRYGKGARVPEFQGVEPHGYGELPFVFVHACPPVRYFETNGIGTPLRKINTELDAMLSDIAEAVQFYARPWLLGRNLAAGFRPIVQAGRVIRLEPDRTVTEIGMAPPEPSLEPLVIPVDTQALWEDLNNQVDHALENYGVPKAAVRMTQQTTASGAAIIQEQMPLIERAKGRRPAFQRYETALAALILRISGIWWQNPALYEVGRKPTLTLSWPEPQIDVPGQERDATDQAELEMGITSRVEILMRRRGLTRDQAEKALLQYATDETAFGPLYPPGTPANPTPPDLGMTTNEATQGQPQEASPQANG